MSVENAKLYECRVRLGGSLAAGLAEGRCNVVAADEDDARRKVAWMFPQCECDVVREV